MTREPQPSQPADKPKKTTAQILWLTRQKTTQIKTPQMIQILKWKISEHISKLKQDKFTLALLGSRLCWIPLLLWLCLASKSQTVFSMQKFSSLLNINFYQCKSHDTFQGRNNSSWSNRAGCFGIETKIRHQNPQARVSCDHELCPNFFLENA